MEKIKESGRDKEGKRERGEGKWEEGKVGDRERGRANGEKSKAKEGERKRRRKREGHFISRGNGYVYRPFGGERFRLSFWPEKENGCRLLSLSHLYVSLFIYSFHASLVVTNFFFFSLSLLNHYDLELHPQHQEDHSTLQPTAQQISYRFRLHNSQMIVDIVNATAIIITLVTTDEVIQPPHSTSVSPYLAFSDLTVTSLCASLPFPYFPHDPSLPHTLPYPHTSRSSIFLSPYFSLSHVLPISSPPTLLLPHNTPSPLFVSSSPHLA